MKLGYWVCFDEDEKTRNSGRPLPHRIIVSSWVELIHELNRHAERLGPICWMQRDYTVG